MADDQGQKGEERPPGMPDIPDVPPPPYPGPPDSGEYPPQQVPPYQGPSYLPQQVPPYQGPSYPPQQVPPYQGPSYPPQQDPQAAPPYPPPQSGMEYHPKEAAAQYPPPGYQYPAGYGQQQYPPAGHPGGYQAIAQGVYPPQNGNQGQVYPPPGQGTVVTSQPVPVGAAVIPVTTEPKPETYLMLSVFTCLCCSPIFGLIAICFAVAADSAYAAGDVAGARRSGRTALIICICGIILTFIVLAINLFLRTTLYHG